MESGLKLEYSIDVAHLHFSQSLAEISEALSRGARLPAQRASRQQRIQYSALQSHSSAQHLTNGALALWDHLSIGLGEEGSQIASALIGRAFTSIALEVPGQA
jgi:hypothetical protein